MRDENVKSVLKQAESAIDIHVNANQIKQKRKGTFVVGPVAKDDVQELNTRQLPEKFATRLKEEAAMRSGYP